MPPITRHDLTVSSITIGTTTGASDAIRYAEFAGGLIFIPTASSLTTLTFHASNDGTTYYAARTAADVAVTRGVGADQCYAIPDECFGAQTIKITGNVAGTVHISKKA